jgi:tetratricopeptide (TPR) repeat protein
MMRLLSAFCLVIVLTALAATARGGDDPKDAQYYIKRATECYAKGQHDRAIKELDEAIRLNPKNALAFSCRGAVRFAKKEYDRAIADLNEAIRLEPGKPSSGYYIRGAAWYVKKDYAKGVQDLEEAIRLNPKEAEALNSRAWAAATCPTAKFRDRAKALDYAKRACELDGWKNAFYLGTIAAAYADNEDFENAVKWQRKALKDPAYQRECGEEGRKMLKLFEQRKPYREEAGSEK